MSCFFPGNILLPKDVSYEKWAVIACDQFTSDASYWERVAETAKDVPSAYHLVFPEIYLEDRPAERIGVIADNMKNYLAQGVFQEYPHSFVYVERTLLDGSIRPGIVGLIDLEQYHYDPALKPAIGATEQTVLERVPPRIAVRREADLEFPHVILFCNDADDRLIAPIQQSKSSLKKLYDFMLMEEGGHIAGWLISGSEADCLQEQIDGYLRKARGAALLVADGNHSLVTAKCWYEELKKNNPGKDLSDHPARYALVELENILDPSVVFEPIHRVIFDTNVDKLLSDLLELSSPTGTPVEWIAGDRRGTVHLNVPSGQLPVAVLQNFLDEWLKNNEGKIDYIHDTDAVEKFAANSNTLGLLLPVFDKAELFAFGASGKILPRKTFSLGHGREKRYYLEGRKIR
ncbi:MAG: DUF1015 domain-containing protein [Oscillospiraceae bacterium]|nr:DUF1015 domain-containing protein [Oscillospiraceae bacterium]